MTFSLKMSGRKNVTEYFGTLTRKDSDEVLIYIKKFQHYHHFLVQIIRGYPIVWYRDGAGAWERLKNRLQINNLQYHGTKAPGNSSNTRDAIRDLAIICESEGADVTTISSSPLSFNALMAELECRGLIQPSVKPPGPPKVSPTEVETSLANSFKTAVSNVSVNQKIMLFNNLGTKSYSIPGET